MNIPIRICPLCSKKLLVGDEDTQYTYYCSDFYLRYKFFDWFSSYTHNTDMIIGNKVKEPHYAVTIENGIWSQSTLIPPFWIISSSDTQKSKIYKYDKEISSPDEKFLLMEVPILTPSDYLPDNFARKIQNLIIFS